MEELQHFDCLVMQLIRLNWLLWVVLYNESQYNVDRWERQRQSRDVLEDLLLDGDLLVDIEFTGEG